MIWGSSTVLFNLNSSSGLPTGSIIPSLDNCGVFPSYYNMTTFPASSFTSPSTDIFYPASSPFSPPSDTFPWPHPLPPLPITHFPLPPPLPPLPLKALSWSLPNCLHLGVLDFLAFAFVISGMELAQRCLPFSSYSLAHMFLEQLICRDFLAEEGAFPQRGANIMIFYVLLGKIVIYHVQSRSENFRTKFRTKLRYYDIFFRNRGPQQVIFSICFWPSAAFSFYPLVY